MPHYTIHSLDKILSNILFTEDVFKRKYPEGSPEEAFKKNGLIVREEYVVKVSTDSKGVYLSTLVEGAVPETCTKLFYGNEHLDRLQKEFEIKDITKLKDKKILTYSYHGVEGISNVSRSEQHVKSDEYKF